MYNTFRFTKRSRVIFLQTQHFPARLVLNTLTILGLGLLLLLGLQTVGLKLAADASPKLGQLNTNYMIKTAEANYFSSSKASPLMNLPGWSSVTPLNTARYLHTSTLLPNGKVLVVGGIGGSGTLASAELYDPATGTWTYTGNLNYSRYQHTATLLPNGKVLVVGGTSYGLGLLASAEIYDPATGGWTTTGSLNTARRKHSVNLLIDGSVLITGGEGLAGSLSSAELYNVASGSWSLTTNNLNTARSDHSATLLANGKVLVVGGYDGNNFPLATELYDPTTKTWSNSGQLHTARMSHTATRLTDGKVLIAGGFDNSGVGFSSSELYDPLVGSWSNTGSLNSGRYSHTATLLPNGKVLVSGGHQDSGNILANGELFDPATGSWNSAGSFSSPRYLHTATLLPSGRVLVIAGYPQTSQVDFFELSTGGWNSGQDELTPRMWPTATLLPNGKVLVAGGLTPSNILNSAELYDPATGAWSSTGNMVNKRARHAAVLLNNGKVLVVGGVDENASPTPGLTSAELYDPATGTWNSTGSLHTPRSEFTTTLLGDGRVLVVAGTSDWPTASVEIYDPLSEKWSIASDIPGARYAHLATLLPNGKVLVAGGYNPNTDLLDCWIFEPTNGQWNRTGDLKRLVTNGSATLLPNGKVLAVSGNKAQLYDSDTGQWNFTGDLPNSHDNHTARLLPNGKVLVAGGTYYNGYSITHLNTVELYDPSSGKWSDIAPLSSPRVTHTATLLLDGRILVVGGSSADANTDVQLYDSGLNYQPLWRPTIDSFNSFPEIDHALSLGGSGFLGLSEASGGGNTNQSATNYLLVQLRHVGNEQTLWLLPDPLNGWSATSFNSTLLTNFPYGYSMLTLYTNAIPSYSVMINWCNPLIVSKTSADGSCGTLDRALQKVTEPNSAKTILIALTSGAVITRTTGITLNPGVSLTTSPACGVNGPTITIQGEGSSSGDGLTLSNNNSISGLWVRGFSARQIVAPLGGNNHLVCTKITKT